MAKSLNVLIGATLDSNVTKNLNAELKKLELNKVEIQLGFDKTSVDGIKDAIKQSLTSAFNGISFVENEAKDIGQAIGENIAKGLKGSKKTIKRHLDSVVKESEKAAEKVTKKLTHAYSVGEDGKVGKLIGRVIETDYADGTKSVYSEKEVKGNLVKKYTTVDNREKLAAREAAKAEEQARKEAEKAAQAEEKRQAEIKKSKKLYKELQTEFSKAQKQYFSAAETNPEMDLSKQEKALRSLGASVIRYKQMLGEAGRETEWFTDLQKKMSSKLKDAGKFSTGLDKDVEKYKKEVAKEYDAKQKEEQRLYKQKLKLNSQVDEHNRKNQEKLKKTYEDTFSSLTKVQKDASSYDSDVYGTKAQKQIESYRKKVFGLTAVINDEKSSIEEVARATERLAKLQKSIEGFGSHLATQQSNKTWYHTQLDEWNKQTDREVTRLKSQYGSAFNESAYRKTRDLETEALKIIKKQGYAKEEILAIQKKLNSNTKTFTTNLRASTKELKDIREKADLLDSSLGRFIQFYGFGQLFGAMKRAFSDIAVNIKEIDSSMVELKKVSEETEYVYDRFLDDAAEKAKALGTSLKDYIDSVTEFKRMGYDFQESQVIAETANIMQMVSESLTGEDSAQYLISIMAAFGIEAENSLDIVDKLNNVDRRSYIEIYRQTLSFYRKTSRNGRPIPRIRLFYVNIINILK